MNVNLLKGRIRAAGMSQENMTDKLGVSLSRFNAKLNARGGAEFTKGELLGLVAALKLKPANFWKTFMEG